MPNDSCGLCSSSNQLALYTVLPLNQAIEQSDVSLCPICFDDISLIAEAPESHWRCLNDTMWSSNPAIQVLIWRKLTQLNDVSWARNLLDMLYLEEDILACAQAGINTEASLTVVHKDSNGIVLSLGDSVTVIKDLPVKGSSLVVKRGTVVRRISLVHDNAAHIEGRVDGQKVIILTKFVKKC